MIVPVTAERDEQGTGRIRRMPAVAAKPRRSSATG